jgi:hypothetical protein
MVADRSVKLSQAANKFVRPSSASNRRPWIHLANFQLKVPQCTASVKPAA